MAITQDVLSGLSHIKVPMNIGLWELCVCVCVSVCVKV